MRLSTSKRGYLLLALVGPLGTAKAAAQTSQLQHGAYAEFTLRVGPPVTPALAGSPIAPQARGLPLSGKRADIFLATIAGAVAGGYLGLAIPGVVANDACQETCSGMWITVPGGIVLGSAVGGKAASDADWDVAFGASALGLLGSIVVQYGTAEVLNAEEAATGLLALVVHGAITTLIIERR